MKAITTREATVKTASIEVKALTIGGKQITLSVFRQLPCVPILEPATLDLRGIPWGRVNYRWGECADRGEPHLHVVWQCGDELRRACVDPDHRFDAGVRVVVENLDFDIDSIAGAGFFLAASIRKPEFLDPGGRQPSRACGWSFKVDCERGQVVQDYWYYEARIPWRKDALLKIHRNYLDRIEQIMGDPPLDPEDMDGSLRRLHGEALRRKVDYLGRLAARYGELSQLDQLFIAV